MEKNYFAQLNEINVNEKTEKKNGLTYLSWAWAWAEVKKLFPDANYTIYERDTEYGPVNYFTDGRTCWVKTGVTIMGIEHIEELPVMDYKNRSIGLEDVSSFDVNKTIQRSLTKAVARHGLGLYIYAGEDLPESDPVVDTKKKPLSTPKEIAPKAVPTAPATTDKVPLSDLIKNIGKMTKSMKEKEGNIDKYYAIVKTASGQDNFRCNTATEDQYDIIVVIHNELKKLGY